MEETNTMYYTKPDHSGQRSTAIGLAAGLGGGALLLALAGMWGLNKASEARSASATTGLAGVTAAMGVLNNNINANRTAIETALAAERTSRENWQSSNQPTIQSYIDVQATPNQTTTTTAAAEAAAYAQLYNNNSALNSAVGTDSYLKVQRYSAPVGCGCDTCNG